MNNVLLLFPCWFPPLCNTVQDCNLATESAACTFTSSVGRLHQAKWEWSLVKIPLHVHCIMDESVCFLTLKFQTWIFVYAYMYTVLSRIKRAVWLSSKTNKLNLLFFVNPFGTGELPPVTAGQTDEKCFPFCLSQSSLPDMHTPAIHSIHPIHTYT